jgi:hypothetical protein
MKRQNMERVLKTAKTLYSELTAACEHRDCYNDDRCYFSEHICLDVDTIISNIEAYLEEK